MGVSRHVKDDCWHQAQRECFEALCVPLAGSWVTDTLDDGQWPDEVRALAVAALSGDPLALQRTARTLRTAAFDAIKQYMATPEGERIVRARYDDLIDAISESRHRTP